MFKIEYIFINLKFINIYIYIHSRQDDDITEEAVMLKKVPSNVSDISDDNTSGIEYKL